MFLRQGVLKHFKYKTKIKLKSKIKFFLMLQKTRKINNT